MNWSIQTKRNPAPIVVRIYELKSVTVFEETSIFDLLDKDTARLGSRSRVQARVRIETGDRT